MSGLQWRKVEFLTLENLFFYFFGKQNKEKFKRKKVY